MITTLKILDDSCLSSTLSDLGMSEGVSVTQLLRTLVIDSKGTISLEIGNAMLPASYVTNPHMLRVNVKTGVENPRGIQVKAKRDRVIVTIQDDEVPTTFTGKLRYEIEQKGFANFANGTIPRSYLSNPALASKSTGFNLKFTRSDDSITWELTDQQ